ncbi:MAG: membrane protein insertase YidC, partial [Clostridiales bacterium]|nr:membrane protein insertase YidC [Clostridiales bacterium]
MSVFDIILKPIELLLEIVFSLVYTAVPNPAVCIIFLSLIVNFLVLPLYNRADEIQKKSGAKEKALRPLADHIKRSFKGDEKIMMLNTLYRQYQYSPVQSLSSIISLILQIPFFIVAYNFLSGLSVLDTGFGPIANLLKPDGLISAGGMKINVLPVLMTVINIISLVIYLKKDSVKKLLTMLIVPIVFLVLLYDSPSGIVLYWTMNNVFSLVKNIVVYTMGDKVPKVTPVSGGKGEGAVV